MAGGLLMGVGADESRPEAVMNVAAAISERRAVANWPARIHHNSPIPLTWPSSGHKVCSTTNRKLSY
jgi:hypothetical protein